MIWYVWSNGTPVETYNSNRYSCQGARLEYASKYGIDWKLTAISNRNPMED